MKNLLNEFKYGSKIVYILLSINILIFLIAIVLRLMGLYTSTPIILGGSNLSLIQEGEVWRLVTANFLQIDILHFLFNMSALYYFGIFLERFYGGKKVLIIYLVAGLVGTAASTFLQPYSITFGASAAIFGFIGVMIGDAIKSKTYSPGLPVDIKSMLPSVLLWLVLGFALPGIAGWGHLGGILAGVLLGLVLDTENTFRPSKIQNKIIGPLFYISVGVIVVSYIGMIISWFI